MKSSKKTKSIKKIFLGLLVTLSLAITTLFLMPAKEASASTWTSNSMWNGTQTSNDVIPGVKGSWSENQALGWIGGYGGYKGSGEKLQMEVHYVDGRGNGFRPGKTNHDLGKHDAGNHQDQGVGFPIFLSENERMKANAGQLKIKADGRFWTYGIGSTDVGVRFQFYNHTDVGVRTCTGSNIVTRYSNTTSHEFSQTFGGETTVPAGTKRVEVWFISDTSSNTGGRGTVVNPRAWFVDTAAPVLTSKVSVSGLTNSMDGIAIYEDNLTYTANFNEYVKTASAYFSNGKGDGEKEVIGSISGTTVTFKLSSSILRSWGECTITMSSMTVTDHAGNSGGLTNAPNKVQVRNYPKSATVNLGLTGLDGKVTDAFGYMNNGQIKLTAQPGYDLPASKDSIKITVGGTNFTQFYYDRDTGIVGIFGHYVKGDISITAAGEPKSYSVTLANSKGTGGLSSIDVKYKQVLPTLSSVPTRKGYEFLGYYDAESGGTPYYNPDGTAYGNKKYEVVNSITLYAQWKANTYEITFNANGGVIGSTTNLTATFDQELPAVLGLPTKTGYDFVGYFDQATGGNKYYGADGLANGGKTCDFDSAITMYAHWEPKKYTITLSANGGSTAMGSIVASYNTVLPTVTILPTKTGYTFIGFFSEKIDGTQYYDGNGEALNDKTYEHLDEITLYAHWEANKYDVHFNVNKPTNATHEVEGTMLDQEFTYDLESALSKNQFTLVGWTFQGWATSDVGELAYSDEANLLNGAPSGICNLYAVWAPTTYEITFEGNKPSLASGEISGATATMSNVNYDSETPLVPNGFILPGYTFVGWATTSDGSKVYDNQGKVLNLAGLESTTTLYALWEANQYEICFNANKPENASHDVENTMNNQTLTYDEASNLIPNNFTLAGWIFKGWAKSPSGGVDINNEGEALNIATSGVGNLYAVWEPTLYTINFNGNKPATASSKVVGTTTTISDAKYDNDKQLSTNAFSLTGWTFKGWATKADGEVVYLDEAIVHNLALLEESVTLYAVWEANSYKISFNSNLPDASTSEMKGQMVDQDFIYDTEKKLSKNLFNMVGWTFKGWSVSNLSSDIKYLDEALVSTGIPSGTLTLYAVWEANLYEATFDNQGGKDSPSVFLKYDHQIENLKTAPEKVGYNFLGYFTKPNGEGEQYFLANGNAVEGKEYSQATGIKLYANWNPITYNLEFYNLGNYVYEINGVVFGELTLPAPDELEISRQNYIFMGWNVYGDQSWSMYKPGVTYAVGLTTKQDDVVVLNAAWEEKPKHSIIYDANGGLGNPKNELWHEDELFALSEKAPSKENFTFVGWATDPKALPQDVKYQPGDKLTMNKEDITVYAIYKLNPKLSYNANGGSYQVSPKSGYYKEGTSVKITNLKPEQYGYTFLGYSTDRNALTATYKAGDTLSKMFETDTVLYAIYEKEVFTISKTLAAGYFFVGLEDNYEYLSEVSFEVTGNAPKVFINGALVSQNPNGKYSFIVEGDTTVIVVDNSKFTVLYNANGGIGAPVDVNLYNQGQMAEINREVTPTRKGYKFVGWSKSKTGEVIVENSVQVGYGDLVLYAQWEANTYEVKFNKLPEDEVLGLDRMVNQTFTYDKPEKLHDNLIRKASHYFVGWAKEVGGEVVYNDGASILNLTANDSEVINLYAVFEKYVTEIVFAVDGGSSENASIKVEIGTMLQKGSLKVPTKVGYIFLGYYLKEEVTAKNRRMARVADEQIFDENMNISPKYQEKPWDKEANNITLYPKWEGIKYNIVYIDNQQQVGNAQSAQYGTRFDLTLAKDLGVANTETMEFVGWSTILGAQQPTFVDGQTMLEGTGLATAEGEYVYLYSVYKPFAKGKITYLTNGGGTIVDNEEYIVGEDVTLPTTIPSKKGYSFIGWSTNPFNDAPDYAYDGEKFAVTKFKMPKDGITLYALYEKLEKVTYNSDGGSLVIDSKLYKIGEKVNISKTIPTKTNYVFKGWSKNPFISGIDFEYSDGAFVKNSFAMEEFGVTLYAVWEAKENVIYDANEGTLDAEDTNLYEVGDDVTILTTIPTREGYIFKGYTTNPKAITAIYTYNGESFDAYELKMVKGGITLYAVWEAKHQVIYNSNGGSVVTDENLYANGTEVTISTTIPEKALSTFLGWSENPTATTATYEYDGEKFTPATFEIGASNVTLYAVWEAQGKVVYNSNGGTEVKDNKSYKIGAEVKISTTIPEKTGYTFLGWSKNPTGEVIDFKYQNSSFVVSKFLIQEAKVTLYAIWQAKENVIYDANEGTFDYEDTKLYEVGEAVTILTNIPTREGYIFKGYTTNPKAIKATYTYNGESFDAYELKMVKGGITLYAVWEALVEVTYNSNGGSLVIDEKLYKVNDPVKISTTLPSKTGYKFLGWSYNPGDLVPSFSYDYETSEFDVKEFRMPENGVTLYAIWEAKEHIIYNSNGGTSVLDMVLYEVDQEVSISETIPTRDGYKFLGWSKTPTGEVIDFKYTKEGFAVSSFLMVKHGVTLYAIWEEKETLTYNTNGGVSALSNDKHELGSEVPLDLNIPTRAGYIFRGYSLNRDCSTLDYTYVENAFSPSKVTITKGGVTLYAVWEKMVKVTYNTSGGSKVVDNNLYEKTTTVTVSNEIPTKAGYTFLGWALEVNASVPKYEAKALNEFVIKEDTILYAVWEAQGKVIYNANGGINAPIDELLYNTNDVVTISTKVPAKDGYNFKGWSLDPSSSVINYPYADKEFSVKSFKLPKGGITLYAVWEAKPEGNLDQQISDIIADLNEKTTDLQEVIDNNDTTINEKLQAKIDALKKAREDAEKVLREDLTASETDLQATLEALEKATKKADEAIWAGINKVQDNLDKLEESLNNKDKELEGKVDHSVSKNEESLKLYLILNACFLVISITLLIILLKTTIKKHKLVKAMDPNKKVKEIKINPKKLKNPHRVSAGIVFLWIFGILMFIIPIVSIILLLML